MLVYSDQRGEDDNLFVVSLTGVGPSKKLSNLKGDEHNPAWSPVGGKVAFESDRAGNYDIWVFDSVSLEVEPTTVGRIKATYQ